MLYEVITRKSLGVIIADHFVTHEPIAKELIKSLEIFANQASLAIEHSQLYMEMEDKIDDLKNVTQEMEKNKDLLVESESYSALGHMSAQLVHVLRNPIRITSYNVCYTKLLRSQG